MQTITISIPEILNKNLEQLISDGYAPSKEAVLSEALSRYVQSHSHEIVRTQVLRDLTWGTTE